MTTVEVLAPVRLETRFVSPASRTDGVNEWMLRLRVYPDEFSMRRELAPPASTELDRLTEAVARMSSVPALTEADAFAAFAKSVGARRALSLWRTQVVSDGSGGFEVDRTGELDSDSITVHGPAGLPDALEVWFIHADGTREQAAVLALDVDAIGADLDLAAFEGDARIALGKLPDTWWLSYDRAVEVGLGVDIDIGAVPPVLDAIVVLGIGDADAADLIDAHNDTARMAVLAPGTPTNTVAGEPTTDFGDDADTLYPLLHADASAQQATSAVLTALTGRVAPSALPMLGGDLDYFGPGSLAVQGFWPVLWGHWLRDVTGAGEVEVELAQWALRHLAVEGSRPAFRVGEQPYGLLPASAFAAWVDEPGDRLAPIEERIRRWGIGWRAGAAARARVARGSVIGADTRALVDSLGLHAPSRHWRVRPVADLYLLQAHRLLSGAQPLDTRWDDEAADALRDVSAPLAPAGRAPGIGSLPGPPVDAQDQADHLREMCGMHPEQLIGGEFTKLGLVGHLFRETLITARVIIGDGVERLRAGTGIDAGGALSWDDEQRYLAALAQGTDAAVDELRAGADPAGELLARRFREVLEALMVFADLWESMPTALFRAVLAALDTAAFRVDPWLTGIAERRLQRMIADGAPFKLGAFGWVDAPAPYTGAPGGPLAPGPTRAGLLHAPSPSQALTSALLRDAAVRYPDRRTWDLTISSAKVRAATALAERVRLGLHPYEALGLEVEKVAGDWDTVRTLRTDFPLADDQQHRRVCDGAAVLRAAREGTLTGMPTGLAARLAPLDDVLDTYADLLVADGVHALVTGRGDLANAAMEAAAGLGAPPDLRAIRTPRQATTVRVSAWLLLAPAAAADDDDPVRLADPAYAAALDDEVGFDAINATDNVSIAARARFATVVGGGDDEPPLPTLTGGSYEGLGGDGDSQLRAAIAADLEERLDRLRTAALNAHDALNALDPESAAADAIIKSAAAQWNVDLRAVTTADPNADAASAAESVAAIVDTLAERLTVAAPIVPAAPASPAPDAYVHTLRRAIRVLVGRTDLPVLPVIDRSTLPVLRALPDADSAWLEIVAAVHPRLAALEAHQLDESLPLWPAAIAAPDASTDPWHVSGPVVVAYGPGLDDVGTFVAIAALDAWTDSVPSRRHATTATFGFNAPKSRAPQAVLLAVPPDPSQRLDNAGLLDVVLDTRELAHARAAPSIVEPTLPHATSTAFVSVAPRRSFLEGWPP